MNTRPSFPSSNVAVLAGEMNARDFRHAYVSTHTRRFLAHQIKAFRGGMSQTEFGEVIGQKQSAVCRLENPNYGRETLQTLFDIAEHLDVAFVGRFVDFPTFLSFTDDMSDEALKPSRYDALAMGQFAAAAGINYFFDPCRVLNFYNPTSAAALPHHGMNATPASGFSTYTFKTQAPVASYTFPATGMVVIGDEPDASEMQQENVALKKVNKDLTDEVIRLKAQVAWLKTIAAQEYQDAAPSPPRSTARILSQAACQQGYPA